MRDQDWNIISILHRERNITKTADLVFMTQPTLTKRIQQIEEELGILLVLRNSKGVLFTPEGEYVAGKAEEILRQFNEITTHLATISGGRAGVLKIGVPNSYCQLVLPRLVKEYSKMHNVGFDIAAARSDEIVRMVENHTVDAGFVRGTFFTDLETIVISTDQVHVVSQDPLSLAELPGLPQIDFIKEPSIVKATEQWWNDFYTSPPLIFIRVNHAETCLAMIKEGLGYAILPDTRYIKGKKELFTIPLLHKDGTKFTRNTSFIYSREKMGTPMIKDFVDYIKKYGVNLHSS
ncbi:MAG: LysR family transcriptional regulator [Treponema sp.]|nr:LysR family transcriptional regulator [Treponema sp.]